MLPEELLVIATQLKTPAEVDCNTEVPVAGEVAGKVYTVLPDADETNAVKFAPLNICNLPPTETDCPMPTPPVTTNAPVEVELVPAVYVIEIPVPTLVNEEEPVIAVPADG